MAIWCLCHAVFSPTQKDFNGEVVQTKHNSLKNTNGKKNSDQLLTNINSISQTLQIMHINIQCLSNKSAALEKLLVDNGSDILCITEHALKNDNYNLFNFKNFVLSTGFNRETMSRGGVAIYIKNCIKHREMATIKRKTIEKHCEIVASHLIMLNIVIICVYRSPNGDFYQFIDVLEDALSEITNAVSPMAKIILLGDFNVDLLRCSSQKSIFLETCLGFGLKHSIFKATRITSTSQTCIDNIFSNVRGSVEANVHQNILSDHTYQTINIKVENKGNLYTKRRLFNGENMELFKTLLTNETWDDVFLEINPSRKFDIFLRIFLRYYESCFPAKTITVRRKKIPYDAELFQMKETLNLIQETYQSTNDNNIKTFYHSYKKFYIQQLEQHKKQRLKQNIYNSENKIRTTWAIINEEIGRKKKITSSTEILNPTNFNNHFTDVPMSLAENLPTSNTSPNTYLLNTPVTQKSFLIFPMNPEEVLSTINSLQPKKTEDIYGISVHILKQTSNMISKPLSDIINSSFNLGIFPEKMKTAKVVPVFKKGDQDILNNYRPIAIFPAFSKVLEKIFAQRVLRFFDKNCYFITSQYGFRKSSSTANALQKLMEYVYNCLESRKHCKAHLYDLTKAFDCMDHSIFMNKMQYYGFHGVAREFVSSYLQDRKQIVEWNGQRSDIKKMEIGVPQGSILGPLFFIIYMNDMPLNMNFLTLLFADDTISVVSGKTLDELTEKNRSAVKAVEDWFTSNRLLSNEDKSSTLHFTSSRRHPQLHGGVVGYLGFTLDSLLTWKNHIEKLGGKLSKQVFAIRRIRQLIGAEEARMTYFTLFHSVMVYGVGVWGHSSHASRIFRLQKKAIRAIENVPQYMSCKPLFQKHQILTLPSCYIYHKLMEIKQQAAQLTRRKDIHSYQTRQNTLLDIPGGRLHSNPQCIGFQLYNKLPESFKKLTQIQFKKALKNFLVQRCFYTLEEYLEMSVSP